jgi:uncharacterized membrane protein
MRPSILAGESALPLGSSDPIDSYGSGYGGRYLSGSLWVLCVAGGFALLLLVASWYRHATYRSTSYDLAVFDQALWLLSHGKEPFVTLIGSNIFADHFSPALVLFVPLYILAATPFWLLLAQSLALGVGLLALGPLFDEVKLRANWRMAFTVAYMVSPLLWNAALFDFHPTTLSVPLLLIGMTAALRDDRRSLALCCGGLLLLRFDLGLAVVALALLGITRSSHRRVRYGLVLVGLAWVLVWGSAGIVGRSQHLWSGYYGYLGSSPGAALLHPWHTLPRLLDGVFRRDNLGALLLMLLSLGFLPLLSPSRLALGFVWAVPILAAAPVLARGGFDRYHYGAPVFPFLLLAAAGGASRLPARLPRQALAVWVVPFAIASFLVSWPIGAYVFNVSAPGRESATIALGLVRPEDSVVATDTIGPHLSHRDVLLLFPYPLAEGDQLFPLDPTVTEVSPEAVARVTVIVVYEGASSSSRSVMQAFLLSPFLREFDLVFSRDGLSVYRRVPQKGT